MIITIADPNESPTRRTSVQVLVSNFGMIQGDDEMLGVYFGMCHNNFHFRDQERRRGEDTRIISR